MVHEKEEKKDFLIQEIRERLFALQDRQYRDFHSRLMPTIKKETIIGVRIPELRKLAKELAGREEIGTFLDDLPHEYYEENNLHGFLIAQERDYTRCMDGLETFLPYIDNWATCDLLRPKIFRQNLPGLLEKIPVWLASEHPYTIRFGIEMLMIFYLEEAFSPEYPRWVAGLCWRESDQLPFETSENDLFWNCHNVASGREECPQRTLFAAVDRQFANHISSGNYHASPEDLYYVRMMIAWYFATALAMQYEAVIPYIENRRLDAWTHNKTIQKAVESYRISDERKAYLRTLRVRRTGSGK